MSDLNTQIYNLFCIMCHECEQLGVSTWFIKDVFLRGLYDSLCGGATTPIHPQVLLAKVETLDSMIPVDSVGDRSKYNEAKDQLSTLIAPAESVWRPGGIKTDFDV